MSKPISADRSRRQPTSSAELPAASPRKRCPKRPRAAPPANTLLVTGPEFRAMARVSEATFHHLVAQGLPVIRIDRHVRVEPGAAMAWLRAHSAQLKSAGSPTPEVEKPEVG